MKAMRVIAALAASAAAVVVLSGCGAVVQTSPNDADTSGADAGQIDGVTLPDSVKAKGVIVLADSGSVKPLKYTEPGSDDIIGLVPDLTNEYAKRLGLTAKIERVAGDSVVPGVLSGRFDAGLGLGDFAERRKTLDFVDIIKGGQVLLVKKGNPTGIAGMDDLCGHKIAITKGSNEQAVIDEHQKACKADGKPEIQVSAYSDGPTATLALKSDRVEVSYEDIANANALIEEQPDLYEVTGEYQWLAPYGVGIPKDNKQLTDAIQKALQSMVDDGTYQKILAKYGQESIGLDKIEINGSKF